jgi:hypothetical protein
LERLRESLRRPFLFPQGGRPSFFGYVMERISSASGSETERQNRQSWPGKS